MRHTFLMVFGALLLIFSSFSSVHTVFADADEDAELEAMQRALNKEIMERPFNPGDKAAVDKYVEDALKKNEIPKPYAGKDWRPGWTCNNLTYSLYRYRNCLHYYRYYGRYYPY